MLHSESPRRTTTPSSTTWPAAGALLSRASPSGSWVRVRSGGEGVQAASGASPGERTGVGRTPDGDVGPAARGGDVGVGQDAEGAVAAAASVTSGPLDTGRALLPPRVVPVEAAPAEAVAATSGTARPAPRARTARRRTTGGATRPAPRRATRPAAPGSADSTDRTSATTSQSVSRALSAAAHSSRPSAGRAGPGAVTAAQEARSPWATSRVAPPPSSRLPRTAVSTLASGTVVSGLVFMAGPVDRASGAFIRCCLLAFDKRRMCHSGAPAPRSGQCGGGPTGPQ